MTPWQWLISAAALCRCHMRWQKRMPRQRLTATYRRCLAVAKRTLYICTGALHRQAGLRPDALCHSVDPDEGTCLQAAPFFTWALIVRSYLGFGLMAARAAVLEWAEAANANPCVPVDASGSYTYAGKEHKMLATKTGASVDACTKLVSQVMGIGGDCGVPKPQLVSQC